MPSIYCRRVNDGSSSSHHYINNHNTASSQGFRTTCAEANTVLSPTQLTWNLGDKLTNRRRGLMQMRCLGQVGVRGVECRSLGAPSSRFSPGGTGKPGQPGVSDLRGADLYEWDGPNTGNGSPCIRMWRGAVGAFPAVQILAVAGGEGVFGRSKERARLHGAHRF